MPFKILHFHITTAVLYLGKQNYFSPTSKSVETQPICFEIKKPQPEDKNEQKEILWLKKSFQKNVKS